MLAYGVITLVWPDYYDWLQLKYLGGPAVRVFCYVASAAQIVGGIAIQFQRTAKAGAVIVAAIYLLMTLLSVPQIAAQPTVYFPWGDFFLEFTQVVGALIVYAQLSSTWPTRTLDRIARLLLGICAVSDALYQAFYPNPTAILVPKWFPLGQMFWTVATTVFFGLAAIALLTNRLALLATRLLTLMIVLFGLIVWLPAILSAPQSHTNWTEFAENFVVAGTAWIVADLLAQNRPKRA